jgi:putative ABC transport system permease protein
LVITEVALSFGLLIGAGLLIKSFVHLERVDPGFRPERLLTVWTALPETRYREPGRWSAFYEQLLVCCPT